MERRTTTTTNSKLPEPDSTLVQIRDRISELPDHIRVQILSFLDTKYAVQTSSLSKSWINLWTSVTSLHFYSTSFSKFENFQSFIDRVQVERDNSISIDKFVFICEKKLSFKFLEKVINYATSNGVKHLDVYVAADKYLYDLPISVFSASSLTTLKLRSDVPRAKLDIQFMLPQLELLHLENFLILDEPNILSKCDKLVEVSIVGCVIGFDALNICSPQLARLTICLFGKQVLEVVLFSSKLELIDFNLAYASLVLICDELRLLRTVKLDSDFAYEYDVEWKRKMSQYMIDMMHKLCHARHVTVSLPVIELLYIESTQVPPLSFDNLNTLKITTEARDFRKPYYKLIAANNGISLKVLNGILNSILQNSPEDAELVMELPMYITCWCKRFDSN